MVTLILTLSPTYTVLLGEMLFASTFLFSNSPQEGHFVIFFTSNIFLPKQS